MIYKIDIRQDRCPMTFVKVKYELSKIQSGDILEVTLAEGEPLENVPASAKQLGYRVSPVRKVEQHYIFEIEKP
ncbi:MAG: sulfurtransferase TusA family protein [Spirochaetia bacterium]|nr:sulfurtransferase TusA family protein [Spirochaetia bacterium]